jgi:hypothetical protein
LGRGDFFVYQCLVGAFGSLSFGSFPRTYLDFFKGPDHELKKS